MTRRHDDSSKVDDTSGLDDEIGADGERAEADDEPAEADDLASAVDDEVDDDLDPLGDPAPPSFPAPRIVHALGVAALMTVAVGVAFSSGLAFGRAAFGLLAVAFGAAAAFGVLRSRAEGREHTLRLRSGDLTIGAFTAALLYALALGGHPLLFPRGQPRELFFLLAYVPLVDPLSDGRHVVAVAAGVVCALEELALRSLIQPALARRVSDLGAWIASIALDAVVWAPTLFLLGDPRAGWNPVFVGFAASAALITGYLRLRTDRVAPSALCRMLLGWALIEFPVWAP